MLFRAIVMAIFLTAVSPCWATSCEGAFSAKPSDQSFKLSSISQTDFRALKQIFQDPAAIKMSGDHLEDSDIAWLLQVASTNSNVSRNWELFMSAIRDSQGKLVGVMQFYNRTPDGSATLGFSLSREHWGQGITTEMAKAFVQYGFETLGLTRIEASTLQTNLGSNRVLLKAGFTKTGEKLFAPGMIDNVYSLSRK